MFSDDDEKNLIRLLQKYHRSIDSPARKSMLKYNKSEKAKEARKRYMESGGAEFSNSRRRKGTKRYEEIRLFYKEYRDKAEKANENWTFGDESRLVKMKNSGYKNREIAIELKRSIKSIERKLHRIKYKKQS